MTYCVYFKHTGSIQVITDTLPTSEELSYIVISNEQAELFLTGAIRLSDYKVLDSTGKLVKTEEIESTRTLADDVVFAIPKDQLDADFVITQNIQDKICTVKLSSIGRLAVGNGTVVVACVPHNPYCPLWIWNINASDLLDNDVKINYTGTDNIMFYTKRHFNTYSHESI
jgi:hypothetical protein